MCGAAKSLLDGFNGSFDDWYVPCSLSTKLTCGPDVLFYIIYVKFIVRILCSDSETYFFVHDSYCVKYLDDLFCAPITENFWYNEGDIQLLCMQEMYSVDRKEIYV